MRYFIAFTLFIAAIGALRFATHAVFAYGGHDAGLIFCSAGIVFFIGLSIAIDQRRARAAREQRIDQLRRQNADVHLAPLATPRDR